MRRCPTIMFSVFWVDNNKINKLAVFHIVLPRFRSFKPGKYVSYLL